MALTIGQVATAGNVNIQTIRYYERRGMFAAPAAHGVGLSPVHPGRGQPATDLKHLLYAYPTSGSDIPYML